jgi:hypothetical protein
MLSLNDIYDLNPLINCNSLQVDDEICVENKNRNCIPYTIASGDSCGGIATRIGIKVDELKLLNPNIDCRNLQIGQIICGKKSLELT